MRRIIWVFLVALVSTAACNAAMSNSRVRKEAHFLTDKMAYELNLNTEQYNDVYEINYDFVAGIRYLMDDVLRGEEWALNRYYDYLDMRNDDLRWVLSSRQYRRFMQAAYFYRPVHVSGGRWSFRVYVIYTNHNHFYFPRPYHYRTYCGGHYRTHYHESYYRGRYRHPHYTGAWSLRNDRSYAANHRADFGSVRIRPHSGKHPAGRNNEVHGAVKRSASAAPRTERATASPGHKREVGTSRPRRSSVGHSRNDSRAKAHENTRRSPEKEKSRK